MLAMLSKTGLTHIFEQAEKVDSLSDNALRILRIRAQYLQTIGPVVDFLQDKNPTLAYRIAEGDFLPEAGRF